MKKSWIPNTVTLGNLVCGVLSIQCTINHEYPVAGLLILLGGIFDRYDGTIARLLNTSSDLGKELDSLADLVSFGVAPSLLAFSLYNFSQFRLLGLIVSIIFPVAGAYRLARYNTTEFNNVFTGVPITICGSLLSIICILSTVKVTHLNSILAALQVGHISPFIPMVIMLILSYLMVSHLQIKKK